MKNETSAIIEGLNSEQKAAVSCVDGPVLIVAGAGSGKTRVLTSRIAYILEKGCEPSSILALTFTKKAASEMKDRIALMVGERRARKLPLKRPMFRPKQLLRKKSRRKSVSGCQNMGMIRFRRGYRRQDKRAADPVPR